MSLTLRNSRKLFLRRKRKDNSGTSDQNEENHKLGDTYQFNLPIINVSMIGKIFKKQKQVNEMRERYIRELYETLTRYKTPRQKCAP